MVQQVVKLTGENKEISSKEIENQISNFERGFPFISLDMPATIEKGVFLVEEQMKNKLLGLYNEKVVGKSMVKFIPASGAASRMFKDLFSYINEGNNIDKARLFAYQLEKFAFSKALISKMQANNYDISDETLIIKTLLSEEGLNYGNLPKGLLKFHKYTNGERTPFEEHLIEGVLYARQQDATVNLHFTVSSDYMSDFKNLVNRIQDVYETRYGINLRIGFSVQKPNTDIIAVDMQNQPFMLDNGEVLFRPGGHGALIENLNDLDYDLIFIKNIDNVVPDHLKEATVQWKKVLAVYLLELQEKVFGYIENCDNNFSDALYKEIKGFYASQLGYVFKPEIDNMECPEKKRYVLSLLDRPIRVCGMVKNEGEPGGGPFWVNNPDGSKSLQIVEASQINGSDGDQMKIAAKATYFNPVDLVCSPRKYDGKKFDLLNYRDMTTGFISKKSVQGRELKAQELPGLWNGAMAFWNTAFVDVPLITFNPVKTVFDLLRDQHQPIS